MFVMKIDAENNTITLGEKGMEFSNELTAYDVNFVSGEFPKENMLITAKVRYQAPPAAAMLCPQKDGTVKLMFPEPQRAVTRDRLSYFMTVILFLAAVLFYKYELAEDEKLVRIL